MTDDYWFEQRYAAMFYDLHGHHEWQRDIECSLCGDTSPGRESADV